MAGVGQSKFTERFSTSEDYIVSNLESYSLVVSRLGEQEIVVITSWWMCVLLGGMLVALGD